jgi:hypothetical protein
MSDIIIEDGHVSEEQLPDLEIDPTEAGYGLTPEQPEEEQEVEEPVVTVTPKQIATFLKVSYEAHGLFTGYPMIWHHEDSWYDEIAAGICDNINALVMRFPAVGYAIQTVDAAGTWGRLCWDYSLCWIRTLNEKKKEKQKKLEEEEAKLREQQQPTNLTTSTTSYAGGDFIIP